MMLVWRCDDIDDDDDDDDDDDSTVAPAVTMETTQRHVTSGIFPLFYFYSLYPFVNVKKTAVHTNVEGHIGKEFQQLVIRRYLEQSI